MSEAIASFGAKLRQEAGKVEADRVKLIDSALAADMSAAKLSRIAKRLMQLGFILLCIAAIRGFLAV